MAEPPELEGSPALPPAPRRNATPEQRAANPAAPASHEALVQFADSVKVLASQLGQATPLPASADDEQDRPARRRMKFQRRGAPEVRRAETPLPAAPTSIAPTGADDGEDGDLLTGDIHAGQDAPDDSAQNRSIAWPRLPRDDPPRPDPAPPRRNPRATTVPLLVLMACNLGMLVFGYWLGQSAASAGIDAAATAGKTGLPEAPRDPLAPTGVSDKALEAADQALKAEKTDAAAARRMYDDAIQQRIGLPGAEYRLALLANQRHDRIDADLHLIHSATAGEHVAACYYLWAFFAGASGNFAEASRQLEAAVRVEPFSAKYSFFRAECLRRQGKPRAAVACFEEALARAYSPEEGDLYFFKLGLAKIESDHDGDFSGVIAEHLLQPTVPGDWLLLAAAQDLEHANYTAAAEHLRAAVPALPAAVFNSRVRDYFFHAHAGKPVVSPYLNPPPVTETTEAGPSVMDPESWSPEKADPGTWLIDSAQAAPPQ